MKCQECPNPAFFICRSCENIDQYLCQGHFGVHMSIRANHQYENLFSELGPSEKSIVAKKLTDRKNSLQELKKEIFFQTNETLEIIENCRDQLLIEIDSLMNKYEELLKKSFFDQDEIREIEFIINSDLIVNQFSMESFNELIKKLHHPHLYLCITDQDALKSQIESCIRQMFFDTYEVDDALKESRDKSIQKLIDLNKDSIKLSQFKPVAFDKKRIAFLVKEAGLISEPFDIQSKIKDTDPSSTSKICPSAEDTSEKIIICKNHEEKQDHSQQISLIALDMKNNPFQIIENKEENLNNSNFFLAVSSKDSENVGNFSAEVPKNIFLNHFQIGKLVSRKTSRFSSKNRGRPSSRALNKESESKTNESGNLFSTEIIGNATKNSKTLFEGVQNKEAGNTWKSSFLAGVQINEQDSKYENFLGVPVAISPDFNIKSRFLNPSNARSADFEEVSTTRCTLLESNNLKTKFIFGSNSQRTNLFESVSQFGTPLKMSTENKSLGLILSGPREPRYTSTALKTEKSMNLFGKK